MLCLSVCLLLLSFVYGAHKETTCECGKVNKYYDRVIGGKETKEHQYPFMVLIRYLTSPTTLEFCGGSIITSRHILTAAHCTQQGNLSVYEVCYNIILATPTTKSYLVEKIFNHPDYNDISDTDDISIILLKKEIKFNPHVGRICLPTGPLDIENKQVTAMGWGRTAKFYDDGYSLYLQHLHLKILSFDLCSKLQTGTISSLNPKQLCAFAVGKNVCRGDSGGPLIWLDPDTNRYTQVALNSYVTFEQIGNVDNHGHYNITCANKNPTITTRVSSYLDWIKNTIKDSVPKPFCTKKE